MSQKKHGIFSKPYLVKKVDTIRTSEWPSGLNSFRQVTEVKLDRVR